MVALKDQSPADTYQQLLYVEPNPAPGTMNVRRDDGAGGQVEEPLYFDEVYGWVGVGQVPTVPLDVAGEIKATQADADGNRLLTLAREGVSEHGFELGTITPLGGSAMKVLVLTGDTPADGLQWFITEGRKLAIWDLDGGDNPIPPSLADGLVHALSLWGDILAGDYNVITTVNGTAIGRRAQAMTAGAETSYMSNKLHNADVGGGAWISLMPNVGSDNRGQVSIYAFGSAGGNGDTNTIAFFTRSGVDAVTERARVTDTGIRLAPVAGAPAAPQDGDLWVTAAGLFARINGVTKQAAWV
ncbi:MAG: hypothetical protein RLZZ200_683 [Pseudomonadota bacterium]|jgi:hypothetical protein